LIPSSPARGTAWDGRNSSPANTTRRFKSFQTCLQLDPNFTAAQNGIGQIYFAKGDLDAA
jgi:hypothetical protein